MKCRIENFESLRQYINWYIGRGYNLHELTKRIREAQLMIQTFHHDRSVVVGLKLT